MSVPSWIADVRQRLAAPAPRRLAAGEERLAAVLVPLFVDAGELWTVLTQRSDELPHHRGQVAFPGGTREPGESSWQTALRESEEEIGLAATQVLRLGELDELATPTGFRIVPCVGAVPHPVETRANPAEIAAIFSVPLLAFANPRAVEERAVVVDGRERSVRIYHVGSRPVWGVTARVVQNLLGRLGLAGDSASAD